MFVAKGEAERAAVGREHSWRPFHFLSQEIRHSLGDGKSQNCRTRQHDKEKPCMVHDSSSLCASSVRDILAGTACLGFRLFLHDLTQAYLQSKYRMTHDIYVDPKAANRHLFEIGDEELLTLELPLYEVSDARDYWGITIFEHNVNDLRMLSAPGDDRCTSSDRPLRTTHQ